MDKKDWFTLSISTLALMASGLNAYWNVLMRRENVRVLLIEVAKADSMKAGKGALTPMVSDFRR